MPEIKVGVIGASSLVGRCVLKTLETQGLAATAFSRRPPLNAQDELVEWKSLSDRSAPLSEPALRLNHWICAAPIWVLPEHFAWLEACGARKVVALSSTSRFTKQESLDRVDQATAGRLADAEERLQRWAGARGIEWVILRPTLIFGLAQDKNISEIVRLIRRFGFFPLLGKAEGLRQPVHAEDVGSACVAALLSPRTANRAFSVSGGETLAYRDMVDRVFVAMGKRPRTVTIPLGCFRLAVALIRLLPRYRHWTASMAERMNADLMFDHTEAAEAFGFAPRGFVLTQADLP